MDAAEDRLRRVEFVDATPYVGMDNLETAAAIERDFNCTEREDMAMARITTAGENQVLCAGIMGGIKAIWARGGGGAKMGSLKLKAIMVHGASRASCSRWSRWPRPTTRSSARRSSPPA
jgi:aldehyde:ferredoxin oxidoreductase